MTHVIMLLGACLALALPGGARADISDAVARVDDAVVTIHAGQMGGAGFVVNKDGYLVTNAHVVGRADKVEIKFTNGTVAQASVAARDEAHDLALLRIPTKADASVQLGASANAKLGKEVAAVGAPLGLDNTVTKGIISSGSRRLGGNDYLQIDAALNPGNSGGPVIDDRGAVIGVSTIVAKNAQNVGFAIPSEVLVAFLDGHGVKYDVIAGDTMQAPAPAPSPRKTPTPMPFGEPNPVSLPLVIGIAAAVSILCSALTSLLVVRLALQRSAQRLAALGAPAAAAPAPHEDLSDIDITLQ